MFEDVVFAGPLHEEEFVVALARPHEQVLHQVVVVLQHPLCEHKSVMMRVGRLR